MDTKNVIAAISLSAAVIILYGLFFAPEPSTQKIKNKYDEKNKIIVSTDTPEIDSKEVDNNNKLSRSDVLNDGNRIEFENKNIKGSISLQGSIIDDLTFHGASK